MAATFCAALSHWAGPGTLTYKTYTLTMTFINKYYQPPTTDEETEPVSQFSVTITITRDSQIIKKKGLGASGFQK